MKKIVSLIMVLMLAVFTAGCGSSEQTSEINAASAQELLQAVWDNYDDDDKFAVAGGDADNSTEGAGKFSVEDGEALDAVLGFPAGSADKIDDAASLMHMMNANTFTCGAFHVADSSNIAELSEEIKENIQNRHWMCGFPDELVIIQAGDYIVSFFGKTNNVDTFRENLLAVYPGAEVVCEVSLL